MFGRFFGGRFFGPRYWGRGGTGTAENPACQFFFTNFEADSLGDSPSDWTERGPTSYQSLAITNNSPPFKRRVVTLSSEDGAQAAFSIDAIDAFAGREDADIVFALYRDASNDHERFTVHVRGIGTVTITDGYEFGIDFTNNRVRIYKRVASSATNPFSDLAIAHAAGEWMLYRLRVNGQATTSLKVRTWAPDDDEPAAWDLSVNDASSPITAEGWIGFGGYIPSGLGESKLNFVSIACGGCTAHVPVLDSEFDEWLARPAKRCFLADLKATGYDSVGSPVATKTVYARVANMGFNTHSSDDPPSTHYKQRIEKPPTFRREMSTALSGKATSGFGSLVLINPASETGGAGTLDDWVRVKWMRDYVTVWIGDPSWHKADFRTYIFGVLGQPTAPNQKRIEFPISDLLEKLNRPLQTNRFDDGPFGGRPKPLVLGNAAFYAEPVPTDDTLLEYQFHDGALNAFGDLWDNGTPLSTLGEIASINGGTDTITSVDPHGMSEGFRVIFVGNPSPATAGTTYYVIASGLGPDTFKISATLGGAAINLIGLWTGSAFFETYGWREDLANGKVTIVAPLAGRVVGRPRQGASFSVTNHAAAVIDYAVFEKFGLSRDFKDTDSFDDLEAALPVDMAMVLYAEPITALAALDRIANGILGWYGMTADGLLQVGTLDLPAATAVMEFKARDVKPGSLSLRDRIMPMNRENFETRGNNRYFLHGPMNPGDVQESSIGEQLIVQYSVLASAQTNATGVPLDDYPANGEVRDAKPFETLFFSGGDGVTNRALALYKKTLGIFAFQTRLRAMTLSIGDTIQLEYPRLGWKEWGVSDPQSPDNDDDFDATKAVVLGVDVDPSDPFPVKLTVFRPIPGYYPEEDLN